MGHSYPKAELYEGKDNVVPPLDLCGILGQEAEEGKAEVCQSVLAGFQDAL
jgi:hypothetical protein